MPCVDGQAWSPSSALPGLGWQRVTSPALQPAAVQVRGCLYNNTFHVVVTADEGGAVCVWNIANGQREGRFLKAHGEAKV